MNNRTEADELLKEFNELLKETSAFLPAETASPAEASAPIKEYDIIDLLNDPEAGTSLFEKGSGAMLPKANTNAKKGKKNKGKYATEMLITEIDAPFQYQEAFHFLRTNIKFLSSETGCKKIIITSALPNEGKSTIAVNLALSLSAANKTVVLIDADLRKPTLHTIMRLQGGAVNGLVDALHDWEKINSCIRRRVDGKNLFVIPSGRIPPNPTELLGSRRMNALIKALGEKADYVIIDTPPVSVVTDAAILSPCADGILMVVRQNTSTFGQAVKAKQKLEGVNANILGVVFNDFDVKHLDSDSGYYSYYYSGNYRHRGGKKK